MNKRKNSIFGHSNKNWNKKASMQLSINMIVILIIAVVILGLSLGFIQSMFGGIEKDFISRAQEEPNPSSATPGNTLTCSRGDNILASPGEGLSVKWGVYCTDAAECINTSLTNVICQGAGLDIVSITSTAKDIPSGSSDMLITLISVPTGSTLSKYLCTATVTHENAAGGRTGTASKDLVIEIVR